jgi:pyruvate ferredoxin oxidoreductase gamma subunit
MIEIRIHGRGGQGNVAAANLVARAAFEEGQYGQAFPNFGAERRGAPVMAFARISDNPIKRRCQVLAPASSSFKIKPCYMYRAYSMACYPVGVF